MTRLEIATDLDGADIALTSHDLAGDRPGRTVAIAAGAGPGEWLSVRVLRTLRRLLERESFPGVVRLVPVADPLGFATVGSELGPDGIGSARGSPRSVRSVARATLAEWLEAAELAVELRCGSWGTATLGVTGTRSAAGQVAALAGSLVAPWRCEDPEGLRTISGEALMLDALAARGVPVVAASVGGAGFAADVEAAWEARAAEALLGLVTGSLAAGDPELSRSAAVGSAVAAAPRHGGLLRPEAPVAGLLGTRVRRGAVLAGVISPYRLVEVDRVTAAVTGTLVTVSRSRPVRPGDPAFVIASPPA